MINIVINSVWRGKEEYEKRNYNYCDNCTCHSTGNYGILCIQRENETERIESKCKGK